MVPGSHSTVYYRRYNVGIEKKDWVAEWKTVLDKTSGKVGPVFSHIVQ